MKKTILKILTCRCDGSWYYGLVVCNPSEYFILKDTNFQSEVIFVDSLNGCGVGDVILVSRYFDLVDFNNYIYTIRKDVV